MEIEVRPGDITETEADAIVVSLFEEARLLGPDAAAVGALDKALDGAIGQLISNGEMKGKLGEVGVIHTLGKLPARVVAVAGLGRRQDFSLDRVRAAAGEAFRCIHKLNCRSIATTVYGSDTGAFGLEGSSQAVVEGGLLGLYDFVKYKKPDYGDVERILLVEKETDEIPAMERGSHKGRITAEATMLARDMVNEPSNVMTPTRMADVAREMASKYGMEFDVFESQDMENMGMGALLGVAKGSKEAPKLITLRYKGDGDTDGGIGFLGKGVTFDSGGISIKPSEGMGEMKDDMAGGAAVIAALSAIARLKPKANITGIVPAAENLPSGAALKPGDILKAMNGKSIEVVSTDAEGRLILADALSYAVKQGLSHLVDLATLTGACRVALGTLYSGVFGNNQKLVDKVMQAADRAGERFWQMPLPEEYKEQNKSQIADVKNTGNKYGGAITAALFLSEFVGNTPWVHIDIAGTASSSKESGYTVKGATGAGVRALVELALSLSK